MMWIAAKSNPYYNAVEEFETEEEAMKLAEEWIADLDQPDGEHECKVYVCPVNYSKDMKTYY